MTRLPRTALACSALLCLVRCDCDGSIADAGQDADTAVIDANAQIVDAGNDAASSDHRFADLAVIDGISSDQAAIDRANADIAIADSALVDGATADGGATDVRESDGGAGDAGGEDSGSSTPDCTSASGLCIKLTWNTDLTDLDLHLVYNGTTYCSDDSCYWANCKDGAMSRVDWDGISGVGAGDPTIHGDATLGYGPEVIKIEDPLVGSYVIAVYFNKPATLPDTAATVEVYDHGVRKDARMRTLSPDDLWEVLDLSITLGAWGWNIERRECVGQQPCGQTVDTCPPIN